MEVKTLAARERQIHTDPYINVALILLSQTQMSVLVKQTAVMRMRSVTIPWDLTSASVKMDFMEMELTAKVIQLYQATVASLKSEVSSASPSSEQMGELWVVSVYMRNMELRYLREHGNEKIRIKQLTITSQKSTKANKRENNKTTKHEITK